MSFPQAGSASVARSPRALREKAQCIKRDKSKEIRAEILSNVAVLPVPEDSGCHRLSLITPDWLDNDLDFSGVRL